MHFDNGPASRGDGVAGQNVLLRYATSAWPSVGRTLTVSHFKHFFVQLSQVQYKLKIVLVVQS